MTVYVSNMFPCVPNEHWRYNSNAYLFADSTEELVAFGTRIGLRVAWLQTHSALVHFDVTQAKRKIALETGAVPVGRDVLIKRIREGRQRGSRRQSACGIQHGGRMLRGRRCYRKGDGKRLL